MTQEVDLFDDIVDDASVVEMRVGQIGTVKGKLESVRYGDGTRRGRIRGGGGSPSLVISFADWGQMAILLPDIPTAKGIRIPLGAYVCVKVQCISEDAEVMALAIWEMGQGNVQPLGEPMRTTVPKPSGDLTMRRTKMEPTTKTHMRCPECGGRDDLSGRADVRWDFEAQDWVVTDLEDQVDCMVCDWTGSARELVYVDPT